MKKILETPFYTIFHDDKNSINMIRWTSKILIIKEDDYKTGIIEAFRKVNETPAQYLIIDNTDAVYPITETLQDWIVENVFPLNKHYKKIVYIYPKDFLTSMNIEEIVKKLSQTGNSQKRHLTGSVEEAVEWLLS